MQIKLIIFDLDGVLIDSKKNMYFSWSKLMIENKIKVNFKNYFEHIGLPFKKILLKIGIKKNLNHLESQYFKNSRKFRNKIIPYKNVKETLSDLQKKYLISIVTSKKRKNTNYFLKKFFPKINFNLICCPSPRFRSKPFPDLFRYTFKKLNISSKNSIYIGDTAHDKLAAKKAKTNFIFANYGYSNEKLNCKYKIKNFKDINNVIKEYEKK